MHLCITDMQGGCGCCWMAAVLFRTEWTLYDASVWDIVCAGTHAHIHAWLACKMVADVAGCLLCNCVCVCVCVCVCARACVYVCVCVCGRAHLHAGYRLKSAATSHACCTSPQSKQMPSRYQSDRVGNMWRILYLGT